MNAAPSGNHTPALPEGERWYVTRAQPREEHSALANRHRQGFRAFLSRLTKTVCDARETRTVKAPSSRATSAPPSTPIATIGAPSTAPWVCWASS